MSKPNHVRHRAVEQDSSQVATAEFERGADALVTLFREPRFRAAYHRCAALIDEFLVLAPQHLRTVMCAQPFSGLDCGEPPERVRAFSVLVAATCFLRSAGDDGDPMIIYPIGSVRSDPRDGCQVWYSEFQVSARLREAADLDDGPPYLSIWWTVRKLLVAHAAVEEDGYAWGCCLGMEVMRGLDGPRTFTCFPLSVAEMLDLQRTQRTRGSAG